MKYIEFFGRRKNTFEKAYSLIINNIKSDENYKIVELGTSRSFVSGGSPGCLDTDTRFWTPNIPSNWAWSDGVFTKTFSDNLEGYNYTLYTIDPNENAISICNTICNGNSNIKIIQDYSTNFLNSIDFKIDFLCMDHMESSEEACLKHLEDSILIVKKNLMNENGIILIDDVGENIINTKGKYSVPYLLQNGFKMVLHEYQVLLIKSPTDIISNQIDNIKYIIKNKND